MKKGMELPINMIVIIALAVLILVIITAFTTGQFGRGVSSISLESSFVDACTQYRNNGCNDAELGTISRNVEGLGPVTLQQMCIRKNINNCRTTCGCLPLVAGGGGGQAGFGTVPCPGTTTRQADGSCA